jgi:hypothetical protein
MLAKATTITLYSAGKTTDVEKNESTTKKKPIGTAR